MSDTQFRVYVQTTTYSCDFFMHMYANLHFISVCDPYNSIRPYFSSNTRGSVDGRGKSLKKIWLCESTLY